MPTDRRSPQEPAGLAIELRAAVVLLALQALGLVVAAGVLLEKTILGKPDSYAAALLGAALALGGSALLGAAARGILRGSSAARSPAIVVELLALPVGYSLAFQAGLVGYGGPILISAVGVLYLLFTPAARAALDRE